jgi:hypothetical protein
MKQTNPNITKITTITTITTKIALAAITIISLSPVFFASEARASMTEPYVVDQLQDARGSLLRREYQLLRDQDDLKRQLDDLKRRNDGNTLSGSITELAKRLDKNYADLRQTRTAIRDVESNLL